MRVPPFFVVSAGGVLDSHEDAKARRGTPIPPVTLNSFQGPSCNGAQCVKENATARHSLACPSGSRNGLTNGPWNAVTEGETSCALHAFGSRVTGACIWPEYTIWMESGISSLSELCALCVNEEGMRTRFTQSSRRTRRGSQ